MSRVARCAAISVIAATVCAAVIVARRLGFGTCVRCGRTIPPWLYYCDRCRRPPINRPAAA